MTVPTLRFDALLLPGMERATAHARQWLQDVLGKHPALGDASLCMTELITNALRYTKSGKDGQIRVEVGHSEKVVQVTVIDDGGADSVPHLARVDEMAEGGRGLLVVAFLAASWDVERRGEGHAVSFEIRR
ncbi:ATP-binding protein [Actinomadura sp. KC216]|uniref:ATP-binding protein n=1 Tax=Actinomadura sp. KC216 TaxID=2530370 RepID=UPI00104972C8|nr:ATP-binding protein [Actinomadura sp. KC216]TDB88508.1 ATP-binding protein [Actinomadura sp. KC216]